MVIRSFLFSSVMKGKISAGHTCGDGTALWQRWASVVDAGPALPQRRDGHTWHGDTVSFNPRQRMRA